MSKIERFRGVPPLPDFDLFALPDNVDLKPLEVAAWRREALSYTERKRREGTDGLDWHFVGDRPRCKAGNLKKLLIEITRPGNTLTEARKAVIKPAEVTPAPRAKRKLKAAQAEEAAI